MCENIGEHMVGNVYVKFMREEDADKAHEDLNNNRWLVYPLKHRITGFASRDKNTVISPNWSFIDSFGCDFGALVLRSERSSLLATIERDLNDFVQKSGAQASLLSFTPPVDEVHTSLSISLSLSKPSMKH